MASISLGDGTDYSLEIDGELLKDAEDLLHQVAGEVRSGAFDSCVGDECHWLPVSAESNGRFGA